MRMPGWTLLGVALIASHLICGAAAQDAEFRTEPTDTQKVVLTAGTIFFALSFIVCFRGRKYYRDRGLGRIPRASMTVYTRRDFPGDLFDHVQQEWIRSKTIQIDPQLGPHDQESWGRPGTSHEYIHFSTAVARSVTILNNVAREADPSLARHSSETLKEYVERLQKEWKESVLEPISCNVYVKLYEKARFSNQRLSENEYATFLGHFFEIVRTLSGSKEHSDAEPNNRGASTTSITSPHELSVAASSPISPSSPPQTSDTLSRGITLDSVVPKLRISTEDDDHGGGHESSDDDNDEFESPRAMSSTSSLRRVQFTHPARAPPSSGKRSAPLSGRRVSRVHPTS